MVKREDTQFGRLLRKHRIRRNISQSELAADIGVSLNTVHVWETRRCMPEIGSLQRLADVLDTPISRILAAISADNECEYLQP